MVCKATDANCGIDGNRMAPLGLRRAVVFSSCLVFSCFDFFVEEALLSSQNPHDYFDDITAFSSTQLAACSQTILADRDVMATYVQITNDTEGVDASGVSSVLSQAHSWKA